MKHEKIFVYIFTLINLAFQIVYSTLGKMPTSELGSLTFMFYIFRPEYMLMSGIVSLIAIITSVIIMTSQKKLQVLQIIIILINVEYILYYLKLMSIQ